MQRTLAWLVGVIIPNENGSNVYLFDVAAGIPIPAASEKESDSPSVTTPATLAEVRQDDSLFRELDVPELPYPLSSEAMQKVTVGVIGNSSLWSTRIAALSLIAETRGAVLFDGLGESAVQEQSQLDRVEQAGCERSLGFQRSVCLELPGGAKIRS